MEDVKDKKRVAIIGAGVSGLVTTKCCLDEGFLPFCFDSESHVGGQWNLKNRRHILKSTLSNLSKEVSSFSDFLFPKEWPHFLTVQQVGTHFENYAEKFALHKYIHLNHEVTKIEPILNETNEVVGWSLDFTLPTGHLEQNFKFDAVIVATGCQRFPYISQPLKEAIKGFTGEICHSHEYQDFEKYVGKTVVVCGMGSSGSDISCELSYHSNQVYLCTNFGGLVLRRYGLGGAVNDLGLIRRLLYLLVPEWLKRKIIFMLANMNADHKVLGLEPADKLKFETVANDEIAVRIATGTLKVKSGIKKCSGTMVTLEDGSTLHDVDALIISSGFRMEVPFLSKDVLTVEREGRFIPLYKYMFPVEYGPSLSFVGFFRATGSIFPVSEMQARYICAVLNKKIHLPNKKEMEKAIQKTLVETEKNLPPTKLMMVDWIPYLDDLASDIGVKPSIMKTLVTDPKLGIKLLIEPVGAVRYRLNGPNSWFGARDAILNVQERIWYPFLGSKYYQNRQSRDSRSLFWILLFLTTLAVVFKFLFITV